jgi:hypothetical protein
MVLPASVPSSSSFSHAFPPPPTLSHMYTSPVFASRASSARPGSHSSHCPLYDRAMHVHFLPLQPARLSVSPLRLYCSCMHPSESEGFGWLVARSPSPNFDPNHNRDRRRGGGTQQRPRPVHSGSGLSAIGVNSRHRFHADLLVAGTKVQHQLYCRLMVHAPIPNIYLLSKDSLPHPRRPSAALVLRSRVISSAACGGDPVAAQQVPRSLRPQRGAATGERHRERD